MATSSANRFGKHFPERWRWELPILDYVYQHCEAYRIDRKKITYGKPGGMGEDTYFAMTWHPFFGSDGKVEGVITTTTDITEQVRAENKLRQSEEFYRIAADAAQIGTWDAYLDKQEAILSPRMAEMMGLTTDRQHFSFAEMLEMTYPEDRDKVIDAMQRAWNSRRHLR